VEDVVKIWVIMCYTGRNFVVLRNSSDMGFLFLYVYWIFDYYYNNFLAYYSIYVNIQIFGVFK
jgi:hypothetical protein